MTNHQSPITNHQWPLLCAICLCAAAFSADQAPLLTVLFTAESHAALLPCDCPLQPLGGVARRASLIKRYRERGPVLLLDGGGWAAGGIYDEDSDGDRERDKLRSDLMAQAMRAMKYDVVADPPDTRNFNLGGEKVRVVSLDLASADEAKAQGLDIVLSRLGEDESEKLEPHDLVFCAGRKSSQRVNWKVGATTFVNFDFQARNLLVVEVFRTAKPGVFNFHVRQEPLDKSVPDDPAIVALLAPHLDALKKKGKRIVDIEYWMMPDCPGCKLVRPDLDALRTELGGRVRIVPHWTVDKAEGRLTSLHGEAELQEARVQVLIREYFPEQTWPWLAWRAKNPAAPWSDGAAALGILHARIEQALLAGEADALLEEEFKLSERRRIRATPSLVVNNRLFEGDIDRPHLLGALCASLDDPKPAACKDAPACFSDAQCRKRGFIAKCDGAGTAQARCNNATPAAKIRATVVVDKDALASNHERIMEALIDDLPGIDFLLVEADAAAGASLIRRAQLTRLPAFLLDPAARAEAGFQNTLKGIAREITLPGENGLEEKWLLLREDQSGVGANRVLARPRQKGRVDLFVSRFSKNGQEALEAALDCAATKEAEGLQLEIHDIVRWKTERELAAPTGLAELEEAARAQAVRLAAPDKFTAYLRERGKKRGSSYWDVPLKAVGIDPDKIRAFAEDPARPVLGALEADATLLKSLGRESGEIIVLAENCELLSILSRKDLKQLLERIAQRK